MPLSWCMLPKAQECTALACDGLWRCIVLCHAESYFTATAARKYRHGLGALFGAAALPPVALASWISFYCAAMRKADPRDRLLTS